MQPNGTFNRVEIYAGDRHLVTYDGPSNAAYFIHSDWQGSERVRSNYFGASYETCTNLPFGDLLACVGPDISPLHYTGKMRDTETSLDYFGARYYSSGMAHWMSPDWADKPTTVPYANFGDPQSLNLYGFVGNNPLTKEDKDGHCPQCQQLIPVLVGSGAAGGAQLGVDIGALGGPVTAVAGALLGAALGYTAANAPEIIKANGDAIAQGAGSGSVCMCPIENNMTAGKATPTPESPSIHPSEVSGKTPAEIDSTAKEKGLIRKGPDPKNGKGSYNDPKTGEQRILSHPNAKPPHAHVNNAKGQRLGPDGKVVSRKSRDAHLPIKVPNQ